MSKRIVSRGSQQWLNVILPTPKLGESIFLTKNQGKNINVQNPGGGLGAFPTPIIKCLTFFRFGHPALTSLMPLLVGHLYHSQRVDKLRKGTRLGQS